MQVACGGYHTLAVCAHDAMQQEAAEKQRGYKQKMMQLFSKPVTVDVPDSRQHSTGPNTAGSAGVGALDRVSEGSLLLNHSSNGAHPFMPHTASSHAVCLDLLFCTHPYNCRPASCKCKSVS